MNVFSYRLVAITTVVVTATTTVATTRTLFARTRFVHGQHTIFEGVAVEALDRFLRAFFSCHLDKAKAFRTARVTIRNEGNFAHFAGLREQCLQLFLRYIIGQVAYVQFLSHVGLLLKY